MAASMYNVLKLQPSKLRTFSCACKYYGNIQNEVVNGINGRTKDVSKINSPPKNYVYKNAFVCTRQATDSLYFNVEDLTEELQRIFTDRELDHIKTNVKENGIKSISFNFIHENIYRCHLYMPIRKLGYDSFFQRYNDDKGLAVFFARDHKEITADNWQMGAYNRRAYETQAQGLK